MESFSWTDLQTSQLAMAFQFVCLVVFAFLLRFSWKRSARHLLGVSVAGVLLLVQPLIYRSPTQPYGMMLSSMSFAAALSLLHWAFLEPSHVKPSIDQVVMSPTIHNITGVLKVHKRMQRHHGSKTSAHRHPEEASTQPMKLRSSDNKPLVVVEAVSDDDSDDHEARNLIVWALLQTLLVGAQVVLLYDVGFFLLCSVASDMCAGSAITTTSAQPIAWLPAPLAAVLQHPSVQLHLFSFAAGNLLPLLMEFLYSSTRLLMLVTALVWPGASDEAVHWPAKIFNQPLAAKSISELWGFRWHQMLRFYYEGLCNGAVDTLLPKGKAVPPAVRGSARAVAAFTLSGLMHEYQLWAAFGSLSGWHMAFFGAHCGVVLLENWVPALAKALLSPKKHRGTRRSSGGGGSPKHAARARGGARSPAHSLFVRFPVLKRVCAVLHACLAHLWALSVMALLSPLFIEPYRVAGTFGRRAFHPLGFPITPHVVGYAHKLLAA